MQSLSLRDYDIPPVRDRSVKAPTSRAGAEIQGPPRAPIVRIARHALENRLGEVVRGMEDRRKRREDQEGQPCLRTLQGTEAN